MLSWRPTARRRGANRVREIFKEGSVVILLGSGGVGKTTIAASLGLAAASKRFDTAVITVDPARRLRDALGLERLSSRPTRLDARRLRVAGLDPSMKLSAMVLDVKHAWDMLVERFVSSPQARRRVLENSFYRNLTEKFAGSDAYAALAQLYDLHSEGRFAVQIVDTPPAAHAFEFLEAPAHLVRLLDSRAARWLFMPYGSAGKKGAFSLIGKAAGFVVGELERFAGLRVLTSVSEFFGAAAEAADAISARFHKTEALLRSPSVHFVLVTTAEEDRLREARDLLARMKDEGLRLSAIVLNRFIDERTFNALTTAPRKVPGHIREIAELRAAAASELARDGRLAALISFFEEYDAYYRGAVERAVRFARELPKSVKLAIAPDIEFGVRNLNALARVGATLIAAPDGRKFFENAAVAFAPPAALGRQTGRAKRAAG
jgi:anion-transporting  ArsA/GET3 family ATPase